MKERFKKYMAEIRARFGTRSSKVGSYSFILTASQSALFHLQPVQGHVKFAGG